MALFMRGRPVCLVNRPFAGSLGAKIYAGLGSADQIRYRPNETYCGKHTPINPVMINDVSLQTVTSPTNSLVFTAPGAWANRSDVWLQVRTFESDFENDTIYQPQNLSLDGSGNPVKILAGTAKILSVTPGAAGAASVNFIWTPAPRCSPLTGFAAVWVSGPTTVGPFTGSVSSLRQQILTVTGLATGTYVFQLEAKINSQSLVLGTFTVVIAPAPSSTIAISFIED